jgi:uncharacterized membrane protein
VLGNSCASVVVSIVASLVFLVAVTGMAWTDYGYRPNQREFAEVLLFLMLGAVAGFDYWLVFGVKKPHARRTAMIYLAAAVVLFFAAGYVGTPRSQ